MSKAKLHVIEDLFSSETMDVDQLIFGLESVLGALGIENLVRYRVGNTVPDTTTAAVYQGAAYLWKGVFPKVIAFETPDVEPEWVKIDQIVDNTNTMRMAVARLAAEAGFNLVAGSFEEGGSLVNPEDVLWYRGDGKYYSWFNKNAKTVMVGSTPETSGGVGAGAWVDRTDATLRSDLNVAVKVFESVADMVADASLVVGQKCRTLSYYAVGDGGGNDYEIVAAATGTADGGSYFDTGSGLQAKAIFNGSNISPAHFGCDLLGITESHTAFSSYANYVSGKGLNYDISGMWNLSKDIILSKKSIVDGAKPVYTGTGKFVLSATKQNSYIKEISSIVPVNATSGINSEQSNKIPLAFNEFFVNQSYSNQGLAYYNGYYYVGYDIGGGNGIVERYSNAGIIDSSYGGVSIGINHAADMGYRIADGLLYVCSGGGAETTYVRQLASDGKSVTKTYDFSGYGNSALMAIDNGNDYLILHTTLTGGDTGLPTFTFFDFADLTTPLKQFTLPATIGTPQGMDVFEGVIYFYTNNLVTLLSYDGENLGSFVVSQTGESEGIAIVADYGQAYIAVGYNAPRRITTIPSPHSKRHTLSFIGSPNRSSAPNVSLSPVLMPFGIRKNSATAGAAWAVMTFASGEQPNMSAYLGTPVIDSTNKRVAIPLKYNPVTSVFSVTGGFNGGTSYTMGAIYQLQFDYNYSDNKIYVYFRDTSNTLIDPATISGTAIIWGHVIGGMSFSTATYNTSA